MRIDRHNIVKYSFYIFFMSSHLNTTRVIFDLETLLSFYFYILNIYSI